MGESPLRIFLRFLRFGALAWGGPVPQIAMLRAELVEREGWISRERFNRVLGLYQVLPGPEATELCVYFGMRAGGRLGGLLAGVAFILPGLALMLLLSWAYVAFGLTRIAPDGLFAGLGAAVLALIVRALVRIGRHAVTDRWLAAVAGAVFAADLAAVPFAVTLAWAGLVYAAIRRRSAWLAGAVTALAAAAAILLRDPGPSASGELLLLAGAPGWPQLFVAGLLAGLLTFGGAYTVIPFLRAAAIGGMWLSPTQFVDGLALAGALPAPLVIFGTFVGYLAGGGFPGAIAMTLGIFLPAFAFTLVGHGRLERVVEEPRLHAFLDGVTAGVMGLIAATAVRLAPEAVPGVPEAAIGGLALAALARWRAKWVVAAVMLGAGLLGILSRVVLDLVAA